MNRRKTNRRKARATQTLCEQTVEFLNVKPEGT